MFQTLYKWDNPVRGIGVSVSNFTLGLEQLSFDTDIKKTLKVDKLDSVIDGIRKKYGSRAVQRATILQDKKLSNMDVNKEEDEKPFYKG
jgi:DNA polymerase-4